MDVKFWLWRKLRAKELMLLNCGIGEDSWESLGLQGDPTSPFLRRSALGFLWKDWCWSCNSNTLATSCEELTHWKKHWCWEELGAGGEVENEMAGWHHWLEGSEFELSPGVGDGQGVLACYNSWGHKESDTTERLNWTELSWTYTTFWGFSTFLKPSNFLFGITFNNIQVLHQYFNNFKCLCHCTRVKTFWRTLPVQLVGNLIWMLVVIVTCVNNIVCLTPRARHARMRSQVGHRKHP